MNEVIFPIAKLRSNLPSPVVKNYQKKTFFLSFSSKSLFFCLSLYHRGAHSAPFNQKPAIMKKILILLVCSLVAFTTQAQTKADKLKNIRQLYAQAKDKVAQNGKTAPNKHQQLVLNNQFDEAPPFKEVVDIYFDEIRQFDNGDVPMSTESPYFMTRRYTCGDIDIYQEWLFDAKEPGRLLFAFECEQQNDGSKLESRYYWDANGLIEVKTNNPDADREGAFMQRYAGEYLSVFETIANRNWE